MERDSADTEVHLPEAFPERIFARQDDQPDSLFYRQPRMVTHIDDQTIAALTDFYREFIPADCDVLDLMSSWISHLPEELSLRSVTGHGMNEEELAANPRLTRHIVQDLNADPSLPFAPSSFDRTTITVSIQYLTKPVPVMQELFRTLRPGGAICIAMSHRCFPTKAILAFHQLDVEDRVALVGEYLTRGGFTDVQFIDQSPTGADPLWLLIGRKPAID